MGPMELVNREELRRSVEAAAQEYEKIREANTSPSGLQRALFALAAHTKAWLELRPADWDVIAEQLPGGSDPSEVAGWRACERYLGINPARELTLPAVPLERRKELLRALECFESSGADTIMLGNGDYYTEMTYDELRRLLRESDG